MSATDQLSLFSPAAPACEACGAPIPPGARIGPVPGCWAVQNLFFRTGDPDPNRQVLHRYWCPDHADLREECRYQDGGALERFA